ncbi:hypothetical protein [Nocardia otitidiscaviarum]|uniref:hypothetical protein n=1 Tax=Nocardia otitidiscaviarum TaxID=1823 RepID=UPI00245568E6|nr:hypothetical protein [Nocardia otitidiscaviarum]
MSGDDRNQPEPQWWQGAPDPDARWRPEPGNYGPDWSDRGAPEPVTQSPGDQFRQPPASAPSPAAPQPYPPQSGPGPVPTGPQAGPGPYPTGPQGHPGPNPTGPQGVAPHQPSEQPWPGPAPAGPATAAFQASPWDQTMHAGYGAQPYHGPPGYGQPPNGKRGKGLLFAGLGVLALVVVGAVTAVALVNRDSADSASPGSTPSMVSALTTENSAPSTSTAPRTTAARPTTPAAVIPGYQVVVLPENGAAYDVPADWEIDRSTVEIGYGADALPVAGVAQEGAGYCPDYVRTNMFLTQSDESDPVRAISDVTARVIGFAYTTSTDSTPGPAESFRTSDGKLEGVFVETTGNAPAPSPGCASTYAIYTFGFPGDSGAFVLTIIADTGVDKAVTTDFAKQLLATLRPI